MPEKYRHSVSAINRFWLPILFTFTLRFTFIYESGADRSLAINLRIAVLQYNRNVQMLSFEKQLFASLKKEVLFVRRLFGPTRSDLRDIVIILRSNRRSVHSNVA